jgi:hypothetical protein
MEQQRNHDAHNSIEGGRAAHQWRSIRGGALRSHGSSVEEEQVTGRAPGGSLQIRAFTDGGRAASLVEEEWREQQQSGRRGQERLRGGAAASPAGEAAGSPRERRGRPGWIETSPEGASHGSRVGMCGRERNRFFLSFYVFNNYI